RVGPIRKTGCLRDERRQHRPLRGDRSAPEMDDVRHGLRPAVPGMYVEHLNRDSRPDETLPERQHVPAVAVEVGVRREQIQDHDTIAHCASSALERLAVSAWYRPSRRRIRRMLCGENTTVLTPRDGAGRA